MYGIIPRALAAVTPTHHAARLPPPTVRRHCSVCDVAWVGTLTSTCWSCGRLPGTLITQGATT